MISENWLDECLDAHHTSIVISVCKFIFVAAIYGLLSLFAFV